MEKLENILITGEDSFVNKLKKDSILKNIFKDEQRESEAIEEIKNKYKEFQKDDGPSLGDLVGYFKKLKKFVKETDNETKIIDDFIKKLITTMNEIIVEQCKGIKIINDDTANKILGI